MPVASSKRRASLTYVFTVQANGVFDFFNHSIGICRRQVNFVQNWNNFQIIFKGEINICQCLNGSVAANVNGDIGLIFQPKSRDQ